MGVEDIATSFDDHCSTFVERWGPADWVWRYPAERQRGARAPRAVALLAS